MRTVRCLPALIAALACVVAAPVPTPARASPGADQVGKCELPPQLRHLGHNATYMAAGRRITTTFADCKVRGGKFAGGDFGNADAPAPASDMVAITIGGDKETPACQRKGAIANLSAKGTLTVRKGPATSYGKIDAIGNGRRVNFCDWSADETWVGVVYPDANGGDCGVDKPQVEAGPYTGTCRTGWINARYVRVDEN
ncbi:MAG: hypothetical protein ACREO3_11180 [Arenimonas sp.]